MDYQLFKDDKEKNQAAIDLESLLASPGWQTIARALDINEQYFDAELHDTHFIDLRPMERLQDRINDLRKLKQLPTLLLEEARRIDDPEPDDDSDVYDSPADTSQPK